MGCSVHRDQCVTCVPECDAILKEGLGGGASESIEEGSQVRIPRRVGTDPGSEFFPVPVLIDEVGSCAEEIHVHVFAV